MKSFPSPRYYTGRRCRRADEGRRKFVKLCAYASALNVCFCWPRPSIPSSTTSPAFKNTGGFMPRPTPGGAPSTCTAKSSPHLADHCGRGPNAYLFTTERGALLRANNFRRTV